MKKFSTLALLLAAGISSVAFADSLQTFTIEPDGIPNVTEPELYGLAISADGKYIAGPITNAAGFFVAERATGVVKWQISDGEDGGQLRGVDMNGLAVGFEDSAMTYSFANPVPEELPIPEDYRRILGEDITADGKMIVGTMFGNGMDKASYYIDGEWYNLPMPTEEQLGGLMKDPAGCAAKHVSGDGKVILGFLGSFASPCIWVRNDAGEYEIDYFPARFAKATEEDVDKPLHAISAQYLNLSNNGLYVAALALLKTGEDQFLNVPIVYNTQTKELKIYDEPQEIDITGKGLYPSAISDDGTFIGCIGQPYFNSDGTYIMQAGKTQADAYIEVFPAFTRMLGMSDNLGFNMPTGITADGRYLLGYTYYSSNYQDESPAYYLTYVIDRQGNDNAVDAIGAESLAGASAIYSIDGQLRTQLQKGVNIVRQADGTVRKILVKD